MKRGAFRITSAGCSLLVLGLPVGFVLWLAPAAAFVPEGNRLLKALAENNQHSGRVHPLQFEVALRTAPETIASAPEEDTKARGESTQPRTAPEAGPLVARGTLVSLPSGFARLELRFVDGHVERYLQLGKEALATRGGEWVDHPLPFLAPLALLQAGDLETLRMILHQAAIDSNRTTLGHLEGRDAYVLGERLDRQPTLRFDATDAERTPASLWLAMDDAAPLRLFRGDGVSFDFGPPRVWKVVTAPAWIELHVLGESTLRLELRSVAPVEVSAASFQRDWLFASEGGVSPIEEKTRSN